MITITFVTNFRYSAGVSEGRYATLSRPDGTSWRFIRTIVVGQESIIETFDRPGADDLSFWEIIADMEKIGVTDVWVINTLMPHMNKLAERRPGRLLPDISRWDEVVVVPKDMELIY